jgi:Sigma-70 region 2.
MALGAAEPEQTLAGTGHPKRIRQLRAIAARALVRFLHRRTRSADDAEDLAQESLTRLMRYRGHAPETWTALLYRIAVNALHDRSRRAASHFDAHT